MSGCKDFNAISIKMSDVGRAQMAEGLREQKNYCAVKVNGGVGEDFGFARYITTRAGVIVGYLDKQGKLHADSKKVPYYGVQLGQCDSHMGRKSLRFDRYLTPAKTIKSFYKLFSLKPGAQPQNMFTLDAWATKRGVLCVNIDRKTAAKRLIQHVIDKGCSGMSDKACTALRDDLQSEYIKAHREEPPESLWQSVKKYSTLVGVSLLGLLGVSIAFGIGVPWLGKWMGPKGGGHGGGPFSGGKVAGGSTDKAPRSKNKVKASKAKAKASSGKNESPEKTSPEAVSHARVGISLASAEAVIAYRETASNIPVDYSTEVFVNGEPYYVRYDAGFVANQSFRSSGELMMTAGYLFERGAGWVKPQVTRRVSSVAGGILLYSGGRTGSMGTTPLGAPNALSRSGIPVVGLKSPKLQKFKLRTFEGFKARPKMRFSRLGR